MGKFCPTKDYVTIGMPFVLNLLYGQVALLSWWYIGCDSGTMYYKRWE